MPHITVKPFDTTAIKQGQYGTATEVLFKAEDNFSSLLFLMRMKHFYSL